MAKKREPQKGAITFMYRTWNAQLGYGTMLYDEPPTLVNPWPGTVIVEVAIEVLDIKPPKIDRSILCAA